MKGGEATRLEALTINGRPVAEVDIRASHLRLVYALLGAQVPPGDDLYTIPGLPREVAKVWTTQALGKGKLPSRWSAKTDKTIVAGHPMREVVSKMIVVHTILHRLEAIGGLARQSVVTNAQMVPHVLQGAEARLLTDAMAALRQLPKPVLALPMHDGLVVPEAAVGATVGALRDAWAKIAQTTPLVLTVSRRSTAKEVIS